MRSERRRKPGNVGLTATRLGVNHNMLDHEKYAYRWINDVPGRLEMKTRDDDWDMVPQNGEKEDSTDLGAMISVVVGANPDGSPKRAYLCRKPKTYFDEDYKVSQEMLDKQLDQLRRGRDASGKELGDYVPRDGISM